MAGFGRLLCAVVLCALFGCSTQRSTDTSDSYIAAVVEYNVNRTLGFQQHVANYISFIEEAANKSADIVVFPEMTIIDTLPFVVPNPRDKIKPCGHESKDIDNFLKKLSCVADSNSIYVVVNIEEKFDCEEAEDDSCRDDKVHMFNTNVVFDRDGRVIDRYRKINLFGEGNKSPSPDKALGVFSTDFGVTFGHFICFDLLFRDPAIAILQNAAIRDVIFPTMWFSELPFLTAVQIQEGYAYAHDINFLAAGANNPSVGSTGSGIYSGKAGALVSIMAGSKQTRMLVATVPKIPGKVLANPDTSHIRPKSVAEMDQLLLKQDRVRVYHSQLIEDTTEQQVINLAYGDTECTFDIKLSKVNSDENKFDYRYRAVAFDSVRSFEGFATGGIVLCSIIACTDDSLTSCGKRILLPANIKQLAGESKQTCDMPPIQHCSRKNIFINYDDIEDEHPVFDNINITMVIPSEHTKALNSMIVPNALDLSIDPLRVDEFIYETSKRNDKDVFNIFLDGSQENLYTFGIWGRIFDRDNQPATELKDYKAEIVSNRPVNVLIS